MARINQHELQFIKTFFPLFFFNWRYVNYTGVLCTVDADDDNGRTPVKAVL